MPFLIHGDKHVAGIQDTIWNPFLTGCLGNAETDAAASQTNEHFL